VTGIVTMKPFLSSTLVIILLVGLSSGSPAGSQKEDDNYEYEENGGETDGERKEVEEAAVLATPKFVTEPQSVLVNEGDTLRLPCIVDRLEGFVMLWKKNGVIITVASQIIDKRVQLEEEANGNYLMVPGASPLDTGDYTCQISSYKPTELTHTVRIRNSVLSSKSGHSGSGCCQRIKLKSVGSIPRDPIVSRFLGEFRQQQEGEGVTYHHTTSGAVLTSSCGQGSEQGSLLGYGNPGDFRSCSYELVEFLAGFDGSCFSKQPRAASVRHYTQASDGNHWAQDNTVTVICRDNCARDDGCPA